MISLSRLRQIATEGVLKKGIIATATAAAIISISLSAKSSYFSTVATSNNNPNMSADTASSVYDFSFIDIDGNEQSIARYKGRVLIVVNVATKCGYTKSNYEQLQALYDKYNSQGLSILGFPCDQFMNQEPGTESEIKEFVCSRFKATFDMAKKVNVNGGEAHPLWNFLKSKQGGTLGSFIKWNFTKFVVDKNGNVVKRYGPSTEPNSFEAELVQLLKE